MNYNKVALVLDQITHREQVLANGNAIMVEGHEYQTDGHFQKYKRIFDNKEDALAQTQALNDHTRNVMAVVVQFSDHFTIFQRYDWQKKAMHYRINGKAVYKAENEPTVFYCGECGSESGSAICSLGHSNITEYKSQRHFFIVMLNDETNIDWLRNRIESNNAQGNYDDLLEICNQGSI